MPNTPIPTPTLKRKYFVIMIAALSVLVILNFISQVRQEAEIIYLEHNYKLNQVSINETKVISNQSKTNIGKLEYIGNQTEKLFDLHKEIITGIQNITSILNHQSSTGGGIEKPINGTLSHH
jgi:hypothetical protein